MLSRYLYVTAALTACQPDTATPQGGTRAVYDPSGAHWLDTPHPDDRRRTPDGRPDVSAWPVATGPLGQVVDGWARRIPRVATDFCATCAAYARFEGPLDLPDTTEGSADDPVQWIDLATGARFPLELRFIEDPLDDPFYAPHTLVAIPQPGHAPPSGARVAFVITTAAGARAPEGWEAPEEARLDDLDVAMATVFTVQDAAGDLRRLADAVDSWITARDPWDGVTLTRVDGMTWAQGQTPQSATDATVVTLELTGGAESVAYLRRDEGAAPRSVDLGDDWPMAVYLAEIPVPYWQGLEGQPWMRFGALHLTDVDRDGGTFDAGDAASLTDPPEDTMRVVVSLPKDDAGAVQQDAGVVVWDHGTGGTAANHVARKDGSQDLRSLNEIAARHGWAIVGHDQPFYGTRWPLMDEGFTDGSLGFYNIVNLPALRDNQRQGGIEGLVVQRFVRDALDDILPTGSVDGTRVRRFGHSLGTVTANVGLAADPSAFESAFLSGPSAAFAFNFLETGLGDGSGGLFDTLQEVFQADVEGDDDLGVVIAAAMGIDDPEARRRMDRTHPAVGLFSWIVDPSDSTTFAAAQTVPTTLLMGIGDRQTVNEGTEAMARALPDATLAPVAPRGDYDPHFVLWFEPEARDVFETWLSTTP